MRVTLASGIAALVVVAGASVAVAQISDLTTLSLEDLLKIEVTSVSRKEQILARTAAAVYVITQEDIRRSGARTIPDLLRMAPGVSVGQIDASSWAISARGFNSLYASKLLVLVDGRNVYSPLFGAVHWDMLNVPLDEIDRIEVIRGPGGTLWGANAVNGVINIITKPSDATQGGRFSASVGRANERVGDARYGAPIGSDGAFRVYGRYVGRGTDVAEPATLELPGDGTGPDAATASLGGIRVDWRTDLSTFNLHGSIQDGDGRHVRPINLLAAPWVVAGNRPVRYTEGNVTAGWTRAHADGAQTGLQAAYQGYTRLEFEDSRRWRIGDVDVRHQRTIGRRHDLVTGVGYRVFSSDGPIGVYNLPRHETTNLVSGFLNDEVAIGRGIRLTLGGKVEHNPYTGLEVQPSARASWLPTHGQAIWAAATRAVRTPTLAERSLRVTLPLGYALGGLPAVVDMHGKADYASEGLHALEAGYRWHGHAASVDIAAFRGGYKGLRGVEIDGPRPSVYAGQPVLVLHQGFINLVDATAQGVEVTGSWLPRRWWKMAGSYAWLELSARNRQTVGETVAPFMEAQVPGTQFHMRSYLDLPGRLEVGALLYGASANTALLLDPYRKLDLTARWRATSQIELSTTVQNLFHDGDREFVDVAAPIALPVRTSILGEIAWRF